jgi:hypothetical protein
MRAADFTLRTAPTTRVRLRARGFASNHSRVRLTVVEAAAYTLMFGVAILILYYGSSVLMRWR